MSDVQAATDRVERSNSTKYKIPEIERLALEGRSYKEIRLAVGGASNSLINDVRKALGISRTSKAKPAVAERRRQLADMASRGFTTRQIALALGISRKTTVEIAKEEGVTVHADRVVGKSRIHDSTRFVETIVMDAEHLTADVHLIDLPALPVESIDRWVDSLTASHRSLASFIRQLKKTRVNVEA